MSHALALSSTVYRRLSAAWPECRSVTLDETPADEDATEASHEDLDALPTVDADPNGDEVAAGDAGKEHGMSFEEVILPMHIEMLCYARRLCRGANSLADDVLQDAYIRAMRYWRRHGFVPRDESDNFEFAARAWMFAVVRNTFVNRFHADRRRIDRPLGRALGDGDDELGDEFFCKGGYTDAPATPDPLETLTRSDALGEDVEDAIASLPVHQRPVVEMFYLQGKSVLEIAAELDIPKRTVGTRLFRARKALRAELATYARDEGYLREPTDKNNDRFEVRSEPKSKTIAQHSVLAAASAVR